jgi:hypothetical protein
MTSAVHFHSASMSTSPEPGSTSRQLPTGRGMSEIGHGLCADEFHLRIRICISSLTPRGSPPHKLGPCDFHSHKSPSTDISYCARNDKRRTFLRRTRARMMPIPTMSILASCHIGFEESMLRSKSSDCSPSPGTSPSRPDDDRFHKSHISTVACAPHCYATGMRCSKQARDF